MSKAFTKEDGGEEATVVRARAPLPAGVPNYVTARGLALLREELEALEGERAGTPAGATALAARIADLQARIGSAVVVDPSAHPTDEVRFGATVVVRDDAGAERQVQIVGVDEASAKEGRIAFVSPLARALLGRRAGEIATVTTPRGDEDVEVVTIRYDP